MKTDETVVFDYLKPDFSILKGRRLIMVEIQPEYAFYLRHRVIHWLNQINDSFDPKTNFDVIKINRYMVTGSGKAIVVLAFKTIQVILSFTMTKREILKI